MQIDMELPKFSLDLVEACVVYEKYFENKSVDTIKKMVQEYKMFWRLANKYPEIPFVPTEELDEVWHLHMLYPQNYYPDCKKYFNGLLHHYAGFGKKAEEAPILKNMFVQGMDVWEKEYGYRLS